MSSNNNNNNRNDDEVIIREEAPVLQSVAIMQRSSPSESPLQFSRLQEQQQQCSPFSSLAPLARNASIGLKKATQSSTQQIPSVISTPDETCPFVWRINESQIHQLPEDYPLERTHLQIDANQADTVAERISQCLRNHSIDAKYNKATVKAQTSDRVNFYIRFYKRACASNKLIVEVQRRSGCSFLFHNTCRSVFQAIRGTSSSPACVMNHKRPRSFTVPDSVKQMAANDAANSTTSTEIQQKDQNQCQQEDKDIEVAISMLKEDRLDSNLMGLETLVSWTQPACDQRTIVAHNILTSQDLLQTVLHLVRKWNITCNSYEPFVMEDIVSGQASSEDDEEEDDHEDPSIGSIEQEYLACMHRQALMLMSNCFDVITSMENNAADFKIPNELLLGSDDDEDDVGLLSILIQDIANAADRPCDACEAAKCIKGLFDATGYCSCHLMDITMAMGLREAIAVARQQGRRQHFNLEQETRQVEKQLL